MNQGLKYRQRKQMKQSLNFGLYLKMVLTPGIKARESNERDVSMNTKSYISSSLIAPCGMNCGICMAYLREKNKCPGCNGSNEDKPVYCVKCRIKNCEIIKNNRSGFCFECEKYPCSRLKQLDKRYKTKQKNRGTVLCLMIPITVSKIDFYWGDFSYSGKLEE